MGNSQWIIFIMIFVILLKFFINIISGKKLIKLEIMKILIMQKITGVEAVVENQTKVKVKKKKKKRKRLKKKRKKKKK